MKVSNQFPVDKIHGKDRSGTGRQYQTWRGTQIVRAPKDPYIPQSSSFIASQIYVRQITAAWATLTPAQCESWQSLSIQWRSSTDPSAVGLNAYTTFFRINYFQLLSGAPIAVTAPDFFPSVLRPIHNMRLSCRSYTPTRF